MKTRGQTYNEMLDEQDEYIASSRMALLKAERLLGKLQICKECECKFLPTISNARCVDCYKNWVNKSIEWQINRK